MSTRSQLPFSSRPTKDDTGHLIIDGTGNWIIAKVRSTSADAAYIVRACNSHEALMRIASELVKWENNPDRYGGDLADLAREALSALESAGVDA